MCSYTHCFVFHIHYTYLRVKMKIEAEKMFVLRFFSQKYAAVCMVNRQQENVLDIGIKCGQKMQKLKI